MLEPQTAAQTADGYAALNAGLPSKLQTERRLPVLEPKAGSAPASDAAVEAVVAAAADDAGLWMAV
jgi:hypothetical protein